MCDSDLFYSRDGDLFIVMHVYENKHHESEQTHDTLLVVSDSSVHPTHSSED